MNHGIAKMIECRDHFVNDADNSLTIRSNMRYIYVGIDARKFTYQFLGDFFYCAIYGALPRNDELLLHM